MILQLLELQYQQAVHVKGALSIRMRDIICNYLGNAMNVHGCSIVGLFSHLRLW